MFLVLFALAGMWVTHLEGYHINSEIFPNGASNPLNKFVKRSDGLWLDNYEHEPGLWVVPIITFVSCILTLYLSRINRSYWAFLAGTVTVIFTVLTLAVSMFPFILPSNRSLNTSLTIWDASASPNVLSVLLWVTVCALPLMAFASRWAFRIWAENGNPGSIASPIDPFSANQTMHKENHD
jgi:cytochrome d ubiquinol oxidase subunit II